MFLTLFLFFETTRGSAVARLGQSDHQTRLDRVKQLAADSAVLVREDLHAAEPLDGLLAAYRAAKAAFDDATGPAKNRAKILAVGARDTLAMARKAQEEAAKKLFESPHLLPEAILTELVHLYHTAPPNETKDVILDDALDAAEAEMASAIQSASLVLQAWSDSQGSLEPFIQATKAVKVALLRYVAAESALQAATVAAKQRLGDGWELV